MSCYLAIDVGTGSVKAGLFDTGRCTWVGVGALPIHTRYERDRAEQDAEEYWSAVRTTVAGLRDRFPDDIRRVRALSVTGQMRGMAPIGRDFRPLGPVLTLYDRRAREEYAQFLSEFGLETLYTITGQRFDVASTPAKLRWLARHESRIAQAAWRIVAPKDYVRLRMTGIPATDPTDAAGWLLYDLHAGQWHRELVRFASIAEHQLPEIQPSCAVAGRLLPEIAAEWHIPRDALVAVGGGDDIAATGCGACEPGDVYEHIGSTGSIFAVSDRPLLDPARVIECYPTETPDRYWVGGSCNGAGTAIEHALSRSAYCRNDRIDWPAVSSALAAWTDKPPDRRPLYLPYITGERCPVWNADLRGAWVGLSAEHDAADLALAIHEGPAYLLAWILEEIRRTGAPAGTIYSAGRGGENEHFGQLRATLYGQDVSRSNQPEATLFGAVLVAATATGELESPCDGVRRWARRQWDARPNASLTPNYAARLRAFQQATHMLAAGYH